MIQSALLPSVKVARNSKTAKTVKTRVKRCKTLTHPVRQIRQKSLGFFATSARDVKTLKVKTCAEKNQKYTDKSVKKEKACGWFVEKQSYYY